jgi:two-component system OmpR family response regulator
MDSRRPRILVVDDNEDIVTMLRTALARHGFEIEATTSPDDALRQAETRVYDAAVLDLVMPGRDGAALATALRHRTPGLPVALLTAYRRSPLIPAVQKAGVTVFAKPIVIQELVDFLESELQR